MRELSHAIEHAVVLSGGGEIALEHLPASITARLPPAAPGGDLTAGATARSARCRSRVKEFEREYLLRAIAQASGKRMRAAEMLGISRKSLWEKLRHARHRRRRDRGAGEQLAGLTAPGRSAATGIAGGGAGLLTLLPADGRGGAGSPTLPGAARGSRSGSLSSVRERVGSRRVASPATG